MKKLLLIVLIALSLQASAQYTPTLPAGYTPFATQMYYKISGGDTTFVEGAAGKGYHIIAANQAVRDSLIFYAKKTFISATSPILYDPATGIISSQAASATLNGYVTTGSQAFAGSKTFNGNTYFGTGLTSVFEGSTGRLIIDKLRIYNVTPEIIYHDISSSATINRTLSIPDASLTIAGWATTPINGALTKWNGTVGLLTNAVSGTDYLTPTGISATSPIFYNSTTGVISSQAASATLNGYLTPADWSTFNNKVTSVTGTLNQITVTGTTTPVISLPATITGLTSVTSTGFTGALTGNASTATNVAYSGLTGTVPTWNQNTTGNSATATLAANSTLWGGVAYGGPYLPTSGYTGAVSLAPSSILIGNGSSVDANALTLQATNSNSLLRFKNAAGAALGGFYWDGTNMIADYSGGWKFLGPLVGTTITTTGTITAPELSALSTSNSVTNLLTSRNTSTGASARNRSRFGNDASTVAFTIDVYGSGVAGNSNYVRLINQLNSPLILGANGGDNLTINAAGTVTLSSLAASGNVIAGADNTGLLSKITIGSGLSLTSGVLTATGGASGSVTTAGGTSGKIAKFTSASNIENSIITESAGLIDVNGNVTGDIVQSDIGLKFNFNAIDRGGIYGYSTVLGSGTDYTPTFFTQSGLGINFSTNGVASPKMTLSTAGALNTTGAITGSNLSGTNTGDQTNITGNAATVTTNANLTGDVISVGNATSIATNAVINADLAQMVTKTYKGRTSALTGNVEDVSVATLKTDLVLVKADVGLGSVDNTSDAAKPVSTAQQTALDLKANLASPALTGTPTAPTATAGTNTTQLATTAFVDAGFLKLSGGTLTGALSGTSATFSGSVTATGGFFNSDIRWKDVNNKRYYINNLGAISYRWNKVSGRDDGKNHYGYSAQDVEKLMPDAISEDGSGFKSVNYTEVHT